MEIMKVSLLRKTFWLITVTRQDIVKILLDHRSYAGTTQAVVELKPEGKFRPVKEQS